jgi:glycosyltransferase involved in cell wall biosynthesis
MRIAYVTETWPPEVNGVAMTASRTVAFLREKGHLVDLIRPRQGALAESALLDPAMLVPGVPIPMYQDVRFGAPYPGQLRRAWIANRPDLVHVATEGLLGYRAVRSAVSLGIPVTSDFRTRFDVYTRYYAPALLTRVVRIYLRSFHNRCGLTFVPTEEMREQLEREGFCRVEVSSRGVDAKALSPSHYSQGLRDSWGATGPVALYVGRLAREKNLHLVFKAFDAIQRRNPKAVLVVVGDGPMYAELKARHPHAIFAGTQRGLELSQHFASADIFLFPSLSETFGNVTLEAMASGLALVAYRSAAAGMHVRNGVNGLVVAPHDESAFCDAAARLGENPLLRRRLAAAARQTAAQLDWGQILTKFEAAICRVGGKAIDHEHALVA